MDKTYMLDKIIGMLKNVKERVQFYTIAVQALNETAPAGLLATGEAIADELDTISDHVETYIEIYCLDDTNNNNEDTDAEDSE